MSLSSGFKDSFSGLLGVLILKPKVAFRLQLTSVSVFLEALRTTASSFLVTATVWEQELQLYFWDSGETIYNFACIKEWGDSKSPCQLLLYFIELCRTTFCCRKAIQNICKTLLPMTALTLDLYLTEYS